MPDEQQPSEKTTEASKQASQEQPPDDDELERLITALDKHGEKIDALTTKLDGLEQRLTEQRASGASDAAIERTKQQLADTREAIKEEKADPPKPDTKPAPTHRYWRKFGG